VFDSKSFGLCLNHFGQSIAGLCGNTVSCVIYFDSFLSSWYLIIIEYF
jgi:hypothetical protein